MSEAMHAELTALLEAYLSNNKVRKTVIITIHGETNVVDIREEDHYYVDWYPGGPVE